MKDYETFPNAPITEALLDIRVELPPDINLDILTSFHSEIKDRFPIKEERFSWRGGFQVRKGAAPEILQPSGGPDGYLFRSTDKKKIVQARLDGFTFNKLKPYENWDIFSKEAADLWNIYSRVAKPKLIKRLALRYINKIEIPLPIKDFKEYILTLPETARGIPDLFRSYFMSLEIDDPKIEAHATIIETFKPLQEKSTVLPLIFDIDVYKNIQLDVNDKNIWTIMDQLREFKNEIFFKSLTKKTMEMFK